MRKPTSMRGLEQLGRTRLSRHFFLRDFLLSEIGVIHGIPNIPDDPALAIDRGRRFCQALLDPLSDTFGRIGIRSGYRSAALNGFGNQQNLNCARNDHPEECHIWDRPGPDIAGASIVVPWFADQYARGRDWRDLAWWVHDHLPYSEMWFFPKLCAFNLTWRPDPWRKISSYMAPRGTLLARGATPDETLPQRQARYGDFPPLRGMPGD
jgi:hypothetical protein